MNKVGIPQDSGFRLERAVELLSLAEKAREQFERFRKEPEWDWENDLTPIVLNTNGRKKEYQVLSNLGFTEYLFLQWERVPFGFVVKDENDIFVVFRGTSTQKEWIFNFKAFQRPVRDSFLDHQGEVHRGFHTTYTRPGREGLLDFTPRNDHAPMSQVIENTLNNPNHAKSGTQVYITGHSLGGALATLSTIYISQNTQFKSPILYSFASPRVGDVEFAKCFEHLECYRVANSEDIVPILPPPIRFLTLSAAINGIGNPWKKRFTEKTDYQHIGEPLYFTAYKDTIADNHTLPTYREALI